MRTQQNTAGIENYIDSSTNGWTESESEDGVSDDDDLSPAEAAELLFEHLEELLLVELD